MSKHESDAERFLPLPPVTFHILAALSDGDRHGYAIIQEVERLTSGALKIQAGTLYRSIQRLLEQGLVAESSTRPAEELDDERRRYYQLTPLGRTVAQAEARRLERMVKLAQTRGLVPGRGKA